MGLSEAEKQGLRKILDKLKTDELLSLADTMTLRMVTVINKTEAIEAIICFAGSAADVMRRKKVKKEYIFKYLHEVGESIKPQFDKNALMKAALAFWGSSSAALEDYVEAEDEMQIEECDVKNFRQGESEPLCEHDVSASSLDVETQVMAQQFARWFYSMINGKNIASQAVPSAVDSYGAHHFWSDCRLRIRTPAVEKVAEGSWYSAETFKSFLTSFGLLLNPFDVGPGVKGFLDPHGLVTVLVRGAVHKNEICLGVFEQVFGLIRDPAADNNWKIKFSEIRLSSREQVALSQSSNVAIQ